MTEWKAHWEGDLELQHLLLKNFLSNRLVVNAELTERGLEEALTEMKFEQTKAQKTENQEALMKQVLGYFDGYHTSALFGHKMMLKPVPTWFVSRDEIQYKQEPFAIGTYGAVHRGTLERTKAKIVVKCLYSDSKQTQEAIYAEGELWNRLDHPNVLKMKGGSYVGSPMYLLCEDAGDLCSAIFSGSDRSNCPSQPVCDPTCIMPLYKQVLLTNLKSTPKDVAQVFQECAKIITSHGGVVRALDNRGEKRFGYGIEDRRWGELQRHYEGKLIVSQFNTSPTVLKDIELKLKNSFPIIRFQTFKIRDPIDTLMNTRQSIEQIQELLQPASSSKAAAGGADVDATKKSKAARAGATSPDSLFDTEDEDEQAQFKQYIPEWKRDAMFTPTPPQHSKKK